jgi:DNA-binding XRE family transcriptional regulator
MLSVQLESATRIMASAEAIEAGIQLTFADGSSGLIPFADLDEVDGLDELKSIELPNAYELILHKNNGENVEIPWDFARHYCDVSYRRRIEQVAASGRESLGAGIRSLRENAGLSQEELAQAADIGRITLLRIENGEQSPRYGTLRSIAQALGVPLSEVLSPES